MKKALMILLGVALVFSMIGVAIGGTLEPLDESPEEDVISNPIPVTYSVDDSYTVRIPDAIIIGSEYQVDLTGAAVISSGKFLNVYINSTNGWELIETEPDDAEDNWQAYKLTYNLKVKALIYTDLVAGTGPTTSFTVGGEGVTPEQQALIFTAKAGRDPVASDLVFSLIDSAPHSGTYKDSVTFTVKIQDAYDTEGAYPTVTPVTS